MEVTVVLFELERVPNNIAKIKGIGNLRKIDTIYY